MVSRLACVVSVVVLVCGVVVPAASARTDDRSKPIVYVHGFDPGFSSGYDCHAYWDTMADRLEGWGHTGERVTVQYYYADYNCTYTENHHGSHSKHHASGHYLGGHTRDTSIRHLGYHLAWMIHDHFTVNGQAVDVVGHSMGGLIARYAVAGVANGHADFPPALLVEDVMTMGTPHGGTGWAYGCAWVECFEMRPGSSFMGWLAANAQDPQATGGTDWTLMGSEDDGIVSHTSAVDMTASHKVVYFWWMGIDHVEYPTKTSGSFTADVYYQDDGGPWFNWYDAPYPVKWTDLAFLRGTW